jgi:GT2 family glycosyltransferase
MRPEAAVIIPHYNDTARLMRCLAALMPQVPDTVEVVVVDNASPVSLKAVEQAHPGVRLIIEPQKGAALARNRGVAETSAAHLFFLDSDCVPAADWLAVALSLRGGADVIGGTVTLFDETPAPRSGAEAFETVFAFDNKGYIEKKGFSVTANLLTRRDVFEAVGPFRAGLSEDLDWCQRVQDGSYQRERLGAGR